MAAIPELYCVEHWQYRAEGNANLVLQYIGSDPRFTTTVLRLRKTDRAKTTSGALGSNSTTSDMPEAVHITKKKDVSEESLFSSKVMGLLLGQEFVEQLIAVLLPSEFLVALSSAVESARPENRRQKGIDCSQTIGLLALDHTRFIKSSNQSSVAVEIKPKWGFLATSPFIRRDIKKRKCRFCMYQHFKISFGYENSLSKYCPIDLFSGEEALVQDALDSLVQAPQNNLRLFIEGKQQTVSSGAMAECLTKRPSGISEKPQRIDTLAVEAIDSQATSLTDVLTQILIQSPLLKRLCRLQQSLDSLDIEVIHRFYVQLTNPAKQGLAQPTLDEFLTTAESFLYRGAIPEDQDESQVTSSDNLWFGPDDNFDDNDTVPEAIKLHYIREFLLSATLKDCSILITVRRHEHADEVKENTPSLPHMSNASSEPAINEAGAPRFKENIHRIKLGEEEFDYKIICIDLDPKKMSSMPMYLNKDREIVDHYLSVVGDREPNCGSR
ncbi:Inositol-pentakisphosphate 2-kinase [Mortierella claussenii]|nr:Inositol-pentakisphosphate 2-kinase [Mortierella claussenii]